MQAGKVREEKPQEEDGVAKNNKTMKKKKGLKGACWTGYVAYGFKKKNGKRVPNCVPKKRRK